MKFERADEFYDLPEEDRIAMIGQMFTDSLHGSYFVIGLHNKEFNYGIQQGLIYISPILKYNGKKWWRLAAHSPDDMDISLDFNESEIHLRQEIIAYLKTIKPKKQGLKWILRLLLNGMVLFLMVKDGYGKTMIMS